jgi:predicted patatin/cPLA2 family phospholipase
MKQTFADPMFSKGFQRDFTLAAVNVETGEYHRFTRDNISFGDELAQAAMASGSIPFFLPARPFQGTFFMDGGTVQDVNIISAIEGCLTKVDSLEKITVDVLICTPPDEVSPYEVGNTLENVLRRR